MRTQVETMNVETGDGLIADMKAIHKQTVTKMLNRIAVAVEQRAEKELETRDEHSKDFAELSDKWTKSEALARFFIALRIDPVDYLLQAWMTDAELEKANLSASSRTRNLKAYKKVREVAEYILNGSSNLEAVFKTFTACALLSSRVLSVIPRKSLHNYLSSIKLDNVSDDLADAIFNYQAKHMSEGRFTQASQMTLTLACIGAGQTIRNGRTKDFRLNRESPVIHALAHRFGMESALTE